jgi:hypothetical protein
MAVCEQMSEALHFCDTCKTNYATVCVIVWAGKAQSV